MKTRLFILTLGMIWTTQLGAQSKSVRKEPCWAAGPYISLFGGYGAFTDPFKKEAFPGASVPSTGLNYGLDAGMSFRNRFGLRAVLWSLSANDLGADIKDLLAAKYPGYYITYLPYYKRDYGVFNHLSLGISYSIPHGRWQFQSDVLIGNARLDTETGYAAVKAAGTHEAIVYQLQPKFGGGKRSRTLSFGTRAAWYLDNYLGGFFAEARFFTLWHKVQYEVSQTALIEQTTKKETILINKTAFGATATVGIFLQIGRWEPKAKKQ